MFHSQQGEDKYLFENFLNYQNGFFIELGAMDGNKFSNTLFFEEQRSWTGILIEPTDQYQQLIKNRPNCYNFNYAISEIEGEVDFLGDGALGGMLHTMHYKHRNGWGLNIHDAKKVKSIPISKLLENISIDMVDLFSIDVEGGELEVLKTFNWKIPVYIVLIEISKHDEKKDENCREILRQNGFELVTDELGCNEVWINKNNKRT